MDEDMRIRFIPEWFSIVLVQMMTSIEGYDMISDNMDSILYGIHNLHNIPLTYYTGSTNDQQPYYVAKFKSVNTHKFFKFLLFGLRYPYTSMKHLWGFTGPAADIIKAHFPSNHELIFIAEDMNNKGNGRAEKLILNQSKSKFSEVGENSVYFDILTDLSGAKNMI